MSQESDGPPGPPEPDFATGYVRRIVDDELDSVQPHLPAVMLDGPKGVGKTETALQRAASVWRLDDPTQLAILKADPAIVTDDPPPVLLDEWQRFPAVWDTVKRAVDAGAAPSTFLLTGSAASRGTTHSGAARIVTTRMRPLTLPERGVCHPTVSLADLLAGTRHPVEGTTNLTVRDYTSEIARSGFPGLRGLSDRALRTQLDGYIDRIIDRVVDADGRCRQMAGVHDRPDCQPRSGLPCPSGSVHACDELLRRDDRLPFGAPPRPQPCQGRVLGDQQAAARQRQPEGSGDIRRMAVDQWRVRHRASPGCHGELLDSADVPGDIAWLKADVLCKRVADLPDDRWAEDQRPVTLVGRG
jgi:hypothetical protein